MKKYFNKTKGFTLLEILLVVGIISLLAGIVIVAINPAKQLATARNATRLNDITVIKAVVERYINNHRGALPTGLDNTLKWVYPGSLIQQDDGESTFGHGYILWDIKTKTAEAFHIPNIYGAITIIRNNTSFYIRYSSTNIKPLNDEIEEDYFPNRPKVRLVNCSEYYNEIEQLLNSKGINPYIIKKTKAI